MSHLSKWVESCLREIDFWDAPEAEWSSLFGLRDLPWAEVEQTRRSCWHRCSRLLFTNPNRLTATRNKNSWSPNGIFLLFSSDVVFKVLQDISLGRVSCAYVCHAGNWHWGFLTDTNEDTRGPLWYHGQERQTCLWLFLFSPITLSSLRTPSFLPLTHLQCPASAVVPFLLSI